MTIHKVLASLYLPASHRQYLEDHYPAETLKASVMVFLNREPLPSPKGSTLRLKTKDIEKLLKLFGPPKDPFTLALCTYLEKRLNEATKEIEIDSKTVIDVEATSTEQHNLRLKPHEFELLESLRARHNTTAISPAFRKEIESDALRNGFRLHLKQYRSSKDEL